MRTDTEMLDWLSKDPYVTIQTHYEGQESHRTELELRSGGYNGHIDFFSCASQHLNDMPSLREAISKAMEIDLANKLSGKYV